ncbi:MAG: cytochrome b/b6 domain-containing protein [Deltaproteobacteria bacterium]|nr:cytochrome b/b6 domain-containing protein [Deltaproteobacteria bacterium]
MKSPNLKYQRFGRFFRIQHAVLFISVILASITGLPMKYPDAELSHVTVRLLGGVEMRAFLHHAAGWVMVGLGGVHFVYYLFIERGIPFYRRPIMFRPQDFKDLVQHQKYNLGLTREFPTMGRYTWFEKFDYLGVIWGIGVMGVTGLAMLYMDAALSFMPLSWLQTLWAAHSEEAMLATLFLVVIHMYHTHFSPERFPMSLTWLHGRISQEDMEKYHPLELEAWNAAEQKSGAGKEPL